MKGDLFTTATLGEGGSTSLSSINDGIQMKVLKKAAATLAAVAAVGGAALIAAPAANATNAVTCSNEPFYKILSNTDWQCFANYGDLNVFQQNTYALSTGNNDGYITYRNNVDGQIWNSTYRGHYYTGSFDYPYVNTLQVHLR